METAAFDYDLPADAIAQSPAEERTGARLLVADAVGDDRHRTVGALPSLLRPDDVLVLNDTRVRRARLALHKRSGGAAEVLVLDRGPDGWWEAMVRPGRRLPPGTVLVDDAGEPAVEVGERTGSEGLRLVRIIDAEGEVGADLDDARIEALGALPLPPYVEHPLDDDARYQTTFARRVGSVAAPTAGLHLTADLLDACRAVGAAVVTIDLQVGVGTFRPIAVDDVADHQMHHERYVVPPATWQACADARRVVAVGTTVVRALETVAATGELSGELERFFIAPGHRFAVVDALLTNFHMPRSSLLVMLEAFAGPSWRATYADALAAGYRFLSLGDAMFVEGASCDR